MFSGQVRQPSVPMRPPFLQVPHGDREKDKKADIPTRFLLPAYPSIKSRTGTRYCARLLWTSSFNCRDCQSP